MCVDMAAFAAAYVRMSSFVAAGVARSTALEGQAKRAGAPLAGALLHGREKSLVQPLARQKHHAAVHAGQDVLAAGRARRVHVLGACFSVVIIRLDIVDGGQ